MNTHELDTTLHSDEISGDSGDSSKPMTPCFVCPGGEKEIIMADKWCIYALIDPLTKEVRYIGRTINVDKRMRAHITSARRGIKTHKANWIRSLDSQGLVFTYDILEEGSGNGWADAEKKWISYFRAKKANLTNQTDGGEGILGFNPSSDTRQKMSKSQTGRKQSAESIAKTRAALLGRKQSESHLAKLSVSRKGKVPCAAIEAAAKRNKGTKQSPEHIKKRIEPTVKKPEIIDGAIYWCCPKCKRLLPETDYQRSKNKLNGRMSHCRKCHNEAVRNRYHKNKNG